MRAPRAVRADLRRLVRDYSRGMRQKIGIIQAFQHDPELAILDEPTEGLDPLMQRAFYEILDDLRAPAGRSSSRPTSCPRSSGCATGSPSSATAGWSRSRTSGRCSRGGGGTSRCGSTGPAPALDGVAGVSGVVIAGRPPACQLEGDVGPFLAAIAGAAITDLTIEPARLEEAFLDVLRRDDDARSTAAPSRPGMSRALFRRTWRAQRVRSSSWPSR